MALRKYNAIKTTSSVWFFLNIFLCALEIWNNKNVLFNGAVDEADNISKQNYDWLC